MRLTHFGISLTFFGGLAALSAEAFELAQQPQAPAPAPAAVQVQRPRPRPVVRRSPEQQTGTGEDSAATQLNNQQLQVIQQGQPDSSYYAPGYSPYSSPGVSAPAPQPQAANSYDSCSQAADQLYRVSQARYHDEHLSCFDRFKPDLKDYRTCTQRANGLYSVDQEKYHREFLACFDDFRSDLKDYGTCTQRANGLYGVDQEKYHREFLACFDDFKSDVKDYGSCTVRANSLYSVDQERYQRETAACASQFRAPNGLVRQMSFSPARPGQAGPGEADLLIKTGGVVNPESESMGPRASLGAGI